MNRRLIQILLWTTLILSSTLITTAQTTPTPTPLAVAPIQPVKVVVDSSFVDDANKAFNEVLALRQAIEQFKAERGSSTAERAASDALIKNLNDLIAIKDRTISANEQLVQVYAKIIQIQNDMIDRLDKKLNAFSGGQKARPT